MPIFSSFMLMSESFPRGIYDCEADESELRPRVHRSLAATSQPRTRRLQGAELRFDAGAVAAE